MSKAAKYEVEQIFLKDDGTFPNSDLPALLYRQVLDLPPVLAAAYVKRLLKRNNWHNSWVYGVFEYHHYHSITHEVLAVIKGESTLQLGGEQGARIHVRRGDVLVIPAGVAHKNLGSENQLKCVGAYPDGKDYDINYGKVGERPRTDRNIAKVPLPAHDPVFGDNAGLVKYW
jgi:uncharacterized protein YjlB